MSEALRDKLNASNALAHAGEVAHWTLLLLGWLWLGEQGSPAAKASTATLPPHGPMRHLH